MNAGALCLQVNRQSLPCTSAEPVSGDSTRSSVTCSVANPLEADGRVRLDITVTSRNTLQGTEAPLSVGLSVGSVNEDIDMSNNEVMFEVFVDARADVTLDSPG